MPERLIDCLLESGARHLTRVLHRLQRSRARGRAGCSTPAVVDGLITTHVGTNPVTNAAASSPAC